MPDVTEESLTDDQASAAGKSARRISPSLGKLLRQASLKFFDRQLERDFQEERRASALGSARSLIYVAIVFVSVFVWQDSIISPDHGYLAVYIRIYCAIPISLLTLWATYRAWGQANIDLMLMMLIAIYSLCMVAVLMIFQGTNYGLTSSTGVSNILIMLFGIFGIAPLPFWKSVGAAAIIVTVYAIPAWFFWIGDHGDFLLGDFLSVVTGGFVGGYISLVKELRQRQLFLTSRQLNRERERNRDLLDQISPPAEIMPSDAIFISYAREDLSAVRTLKATLDAAGLTVWFDFDRLAAGDSFDQKIRHNIRLCSLFIAVLSSNTEARSEGYFRREWRYALDRDLDIDPATPFIIPIAIDGGLRLNNLPHRFSEINVTSLPEGQPTAEFIERLKQIVQAPRLPREVGAQPVRATV